MQALMNELYKQNEVKFLKVDKVIEENQIAGSIHDLERINTFLKSIKFNEDSEVVDLLQRISKQADEVFFFKG